MGDYFSCEEKQILRRMNGNYYKFGSGKVRVTHSRSMGNP